MVRRVYRKKRAMKRKPMRKRVARKRQVVRRLNSSNQGYINVNRRLEFMSIQQGDVGAVTVTDPSATCIQVGAPTAVPGAISGLYDIPFSMKFRLDQLAGYTDFTALFDNYKINGVKVFVKAFYNNSTVTSIGLPWLEHWNDQDDAIPNSASAARQHMGTKHKYFSGNKIVTSMYCKPRIIDEVYGNGTISPQPAGISRVATWLNCSNQGIEHYAIKGILHNVYLNGSIGGNQFQFDVVVNASFKDVQ